VVSLGPVQLMSLRLMRERGIITQAEYDSAAHELAESVGTQAEAKEHVVVGKWSTTLYGFVEVDSIWDSTRSFNDQQGNALVARAGTTAGDNDRWQIGARNSRIGLRLAAPEFHSVRASGMVETDFLGTQLPVGTGPYSTTAGTNAFYGTEAAYFTNPTFRIRHMNLRVETPVVDILFGQYWQLFGWAATYQPNTLLFGGVPGEIYSRTIQFRVSKTVTTDAITFDAAVAAIRPAQRDSGTPDGEAGLRLAFNGWQGVQTVSSTGTQAAPLSFGVSGLLRHVAVNDLVPSGTTNTQDLTTSAIVADALVPVTRATVDKRDNALTLIGEFATGYGDADMYTGLTGGIGFPAVAGGYSPDIDSGIVTFDTSGKLHGIQYTSYLVGAQYYLPVFDGRVWIAGNYSHLESANSHYYTFITNSGTKPPLGCLAGAARTSTSCGVLAANDFFDVSLFVDPVSAVRFGLDYANTRTTYVDGIAAINHRIQFSGFFIF
jgi:hypothetical protein